MAERTLFAGASDGRDHSHLFMVRLWTEDVGDGHREWRGKVQHVLSGEAIYFRDCAALVAFLSAWVEHRGDAASSAPRSQER